MASTPAMKATFFLGLGTAGWTETFYTAPGSHQSVMNKAYALAALRAKMLPIGGYLRYIRVSDNQIDRDAIVSEPFFYTYPLGTGEGAFNLFEGGTQVAGVIQRACNNPWSALLMRMTGTPTGWRNMYFRGLPDNMVNVNGGFLTTDYENAWKAWRGKLITDAWGFISLAKDPAVVPPKPISTMVYNDTTKLLTLLITASGFVAGDSIRIKGGKGSGLPRGSFTVKEVIGSSVDVYWKDGDQPLYEGGAVAVKNVKQLVTFATVQTERLVTRRVGRPFAQPVGRRSTK